jgi:hypothetical protein
MVLLLLLARQRVHDITDKALKRRKEARASFKLRLYRCRGSLSDKKLRRPVLVARLYHLDGVRTRLQLELLRGTPDPFRVNE